MSQKKRNQHYVPRILLRGFSADGRSISLHLLRNGRQISGASIGDQCCKSYFYGEDESIENGLAEIEGQFAKALGDKSRSTLESSTADSKELIVLFVHLQRARTAAAASEVNAVNDGLIRRVLENDSRFQESGIDLSHLQFHVTEPQMVALQHAIESLPLVSDLDVKFIVTGKKPKFVISDDPVVLYNQYAEQHPRFRRWPNHTGMAHKGLQIFLPVSPTVCIALFDPATYDYGSRKSLVCTPSISDIRRLNDLQALNARECIYYDPRATLPEELQRLHQIHAVARETRVPSFTTSRERSEGGGTHSQLIAVHSTSPRLDHSFGFARVTDFASYDDWNFATIPVRSLEAIAVMEANASRNGQDPDANVVAPRNDRG